MQKLTLSKKVCATAVSLALVGASGPAAAFAADASVTGEAVNVQVQAATGAYSFDNTVIEKTGRQYYAYTGRAIDVGIQVIKDEDEDVVPSSAYILKYERADSENGDYQSVEAPVEPGYYKVHAEANPHSGYSGSTDSESFIILDADQAKDLQYAVITNYWLNENGYGHNIGYTGKPVVLGWNVLMADGSTAKQGVDYTVSFESRNSDGAYKEFSGTPSQPGRYRAVLRGSSEKCSGTWYYHFAIVKDSADYVSSMIEAVCVKGKLTLGDAEMVQTVRAAYNALSSDAKAEFTESEWAYGPDQLAEAEAQIAKLRQPAADRATAGKVMKSIQALPAKVTSDVRAKKVAAAKAAYDKLTGAQKSLVSKSAKSKLDKAVASAAKFAAAQKTVTVNVKTVSAKAVDKAVRKAKSSKGKVKTIVLGKKVKKVAKGAFKKYKKAKTLVVQSKKLTKKSVKGALKGSKVTTIKVQVGSAKTNKSYAKKYKKVFTKANTGKKVKIVSVK